MSEILAIDNGLNGGIVHINSKGEIIGRAIIANVVEDGRNRVDVEALYEIAKELGHNVKVVLEKPVGSQSVQAATSMADSYARTVSAFTIAGFVVIPIAARTWQSALFRGVKGDNTKDKASKVFKAVFPGHVEEFSTTRKGNTSKNLHDGLADAALIARYVLDTNYNGKG